MHSIEYDTSSMHKQQSANMNSTSGDEMDLTHFDAKGDAHMVDVSQKPVTHRIAVAQGSILMNKKTLQLIQKGDAKKGDVLGVARIAGIQGAKKTSDLIPLCHPLFLTRVTLDWSLIERENEHGLRCQVQAETLGSTGVEMEALTGVQVALLTVYDMCKAVDRGMVMTHVSLLEKHGGRSGSYKAA